MHAIGVEGIVGEAGQTYTFLVFVSFSQFSKVMPPVLAWPLTTPGASTANMIAITKTAPKLPAFGIR
jgi:hypothetical protein